MRYCSESPASSLVRSMYEVPAGTEESTVDHPPPLTFSWSVPVDVPSIVRLIRTSTQPVQPIRHVPGSVSWATESMVGAVV